MLGMNQPKMDMDVCFSNCLGNADSLLAMLLVVGNVVKLVIILTHWDNDNDGLLESIGLLSLLLLSTVKHGMGMLYPKFVLNTMTGDNFAPNSTCIMTGFGCEYRRCDVVARMTFPVTILGVCKMTACPLAPGSDGTVNNNGFVNNCSMVSLATLTYTGKFNAGITRCG